METPPLHADPDTSAQLEVFASRVQESPHNLVSRRAREELRTRHVPECVAFARTLPAGGGRVLDLGSGGGFPGVVVAICRPDLEVHLLDATAKKTGFLQEVSDELGLGCTVHTGRAEELSTGGDLRGTFDVVTARAVAPLDRLIGWSLPFLRRNGLLYAMKGDRWAEELEAAIPVMERLGAAVVATPEDDLHRADAADTESQPRVVIVTRIR